MVVWCLISLLGALRKIGVCNGPRPNVGTTHEKGHTNMLSLKKKIGWWSLNNIKLTIFFVGWWCQINFLVSL